MSVSFSEVSHFITPPLPPPPSSHFNKLTICFIGILVSACCIRSCGNGYLISVHLVYCRVPGYRVVSGTGWCCRRWMFLGRQSSRHISMKVEQLNTRWPSEILLVHFYSSGGWQLRKATANIQIVHKNKIYSLVNNIMTIKNSNFKANLTWFSTTIRE